MKTEMAFFSKADATEVFIFLVEAVAGEERIKYNVEYMYWC